MTTSFRARFPISAISGLKVFERDTVPPAEWAKKQSSGLKTGDIVVCFSPFSTAAGAAAELETSAVVLVVNADEPDTAPLCMLMTDDFYVVGTSESIFKERAVSATARGNNFSFVVIPYVGVMTEEARKVITGMNRWGQGGTRANPMHGLPDPLVAFFACVGAQLPDSPPVAIGAIAQALIMGINMPPIPDLSSKYSLAMKLSNEPVISSVTVIETPAAPTEPQPVSTPEKEPEPASPPAAEKEPEPVSPPAPAKEPEPVIAEVAAPPPAREEIPAKKIEPLETKSDLADLATVLTDQASDVLAAKEQVSTVPSQVVSAPTAPSTPTASTSIGTEAQSSTQDTSGAADTGFLSIRKRLEARLSGRLPKSAGGTGDASAPQKSEHAVSPVVKLVSNIRQQMSIASDNLEYRVSTLKSKMLDRLVSCKHNLSEKEQLSLKTLEDLRSEMLGKLEATAARAKEDLSKTAAKGTADVREFQSRATGRLAELLKEQEKLIGEFSEDARKQINASLSATRDELNKTASRAQHALRGQVTTTEVNLNQVINQCAESMDERIDGFRAQTQILAEGIGLSVESLGEASKLQAHQSEDEVIKRIESLSEDAMKSLREQSVKAEMECAKLIDKLSRDKLVPTLQEKRRIVVDLAAFYHDEFGGVMQELLESKLSDFEPIVRSNAESLSSSLRDFRNRWTTNLEQHQKELDETETRLNNKVENHLAAAKSRLESMQDVTKVTDHVLTSPELIRTRDETCLKFDIVAREHVSRAYTQSGDKVQTYKQEALNEMIELRESSETALRSRGEESRTRIRNAIKSAMQKIQDQQARYTI